jgi:hypothetical protein
MANKSHHMLNPNVSLYTHKPEVWLLPTFVKDPMLISTMINNKQLFSIFSDLINKQGKLIDFMLVIQTNGQIGLRFNANNSAPSLEIWPTLERSIVTNFQNISNLNLPIKNCTLTTLNSLKPIEIIHSFRGVQSRLKYTNYIYCQSSWKVGKTIFKTPFNQYLNSTFYMYDRRWLAHRNTISTRYVKLRDNTQNIKGKVAPDYYEVYSLAPLKDLPICYALPSCVWDVSNGLVVKRVTTFHHILYERKYSMVFNFFTIHPIVYDNGPNYISTIKPYQNSPISFFDLSSPVKEEMHNIFYNFFRLFTIHHTNNFIYSFDETVFAWWGELDMNRLPPRFASNLYLDTFIHSDYNNRTDNSLFALHPLQIKSI